jgi:hypothetical protein
MTNCARQRPGFPVFAMQTMQNAAHELAAIESLRLSFGASVRYSKPAFGFCLGSAPVEVCYANLPGQSFRTC